MRSRKDLRVWSSEQSDLTYPCIWTLCRLCSRSCELSKLSRNDGLGETLVTGVRLTGVGRGRAGASARRRIRGNWLIGNRGCWAGGGRIVRDGARSSDGGTRLRLSSRLIDGSVWLRDRIGIPLTAIRRAASLRIQTNRLPRRPTSRKRWIPTWV